jgi:Mor family transcriptional regulator
MDIKDIREEDLPQKYKELAKVIGFEAALKLGQEFGGEQFYLPKLNGCGGPLTYARNRKILEELKTHTGSIVALARKYKVTSRSIYDLIQAEQAKQTPSNG